MVGERNQQQQNQKKKKKCIVNYRGCCCCGLRRTFKAISFMFPCRPSLRLDPPSNLYFPYEPGNQVRSSVKIVNTGHLPVAFKFQTTAPKSCFMRPPSALLAPGESIIATVFKFVEPEEESEEKPLKKPKKKKKHKFKILSIKIKGNTQYSPDMFDEQRGIQAVEQILTVTILDPNTPSQAMEKLKQQLAEADAEARKNPSPSLLPRPVPTDEENDQPDPVHTTNERASKPDN